MQLGEIGRMVSRSAYAQLDDYANVAPLAEALATSDKATDQEKAMYKQAEANQGAAEGGAAGAEGKKNEDVVDAEFTEVNDDKNNKKSA